jgi:hypothetical protein
VCEAWSVTVVEEHKLRVFVNRVLGKILGNKRGKEPGHWMGLHNGKLHELLFVNKYHKSIQ